MRGQRKVMPRKDFFDSKFLPNVFVWWYTISMKYDLSQEYFARAYRTGTDIWTHIPFQMKGGELLQTLKPGALVLDLGSGRGRFPFQLLEHGVRVIGLDYVPEIIGKSNQEVKDLDLERVSRFVVGDALDIPFSDEGFDAVVDIGLLEHIARDDWEQYISEVSRVLKPGGYFYLIALSRETSSYLSWHPKKDGAGDYESDGVFYHFFTGEELSELFEKEFEIISERVEHVPGHNNTSFVIALMRK